jgi:hypothetical protein
MDHPKERQRNGNRVDVAFMSFLDVSLGNDLVDEYSTTLTNQVTKIVNPTE